MGFRNICLFLLIINRVEAAVFTPEFEEDLYSFINATMKCRNIPGLTLSVFRVNESWAHGFGTADFEKGEKVTPQTLFGIGSITKAFTTTLVSVLFKDRGLDWPVKISDLIEGFRFSSDERTKYTMMRDILSHRTGLARLDIGLLAGYPSSVNRSELSRRLEYLPEQKPLRDSFIYNNYMYMLAGHVAEVLSGASWEDAVTSTVLRPIGMLSTRLLKQPTDVLADDVAKPYRLEGDKMVNGTLELYDIHPSEPAGAIFSSGEDMAKWLQFILQQGNLTFGNTADMNEAFESHVAPEPINLKKNRQVYKPDFPVDDTPQGYGYGWFPSTYRGYRKFSHSGGLFSYISLINAFPDLGFGIFGSTNGPVHDDDSILALRTIFYYIADHIIGETPWLNETTSCSFPKPWRDWYKNTTRNSSTGNTFQYSGFQEYEGQYGHHFLPDVAISSNISNLLLSMGRVKGVLLATPEKDKFDWKLTYPIEIASSFVDRSGNPTLFHVNFTRNGPNDAVSGFGADFDVPTTFQKGVTFADVPFTSGSASLCFSKLLYFAIFKVIHALRQQL